MPSSLTSSLLASAQRPASALLRSRLVAALSAPHGVDHYLALVNPAWSTQQVRARVTEVRRETRDAVSLLLAPNARWQGFVAGQYVQLSVVIGGIRHTRTFSISSAPRDGVPLRLTLREFADGRISGWASHVARPGDVVELSPAQGTFVMPAPAPAQLLFISAGSGITPMVSMLRQLLFSGYRGAITCLHYARREVIFQDELDALGRTFPNFRFVPRLTAPRTGAEKAARRFDRQALEAAAPDWRRCETFVCGPAALERSVRAVLDEEGLADHLHVERFKLQAFSSSSTDDASRSRVHRLELSKSNVVLEGHSTTSLLEQAEAAGLRPAYGCRMGICHTCKCTKRSGVVRNELTGQISGAHEEQIQLCISTPLSDLALDL